MSHLNFVYNHRSLSENNDHIWLPLIILSILMILFILCAWCGLFLCCVRKYCCKPRISVSRTTDSTKSTPRAEIEVIPRQVVVTPGPLKNQQVKKSMKGVSRIQYLGTLER